MKLKHFGQGPQAIFHTISIDMSYKLHLFNKILVISIYQHNCIKYCIDKRLVQN